MAGEPARLTVAVTSTSAGVCDLCGAEPSQLSAAVLVSHAHGGSVRFNTCNRCAQAMRRVVAAICGHCDVTVEPEPAAPEPPSPGDMPFVRPPVLIGILPDGFVDNDGVRCLVRIYGDERLDGTWIGWIEFEAVDTGVTLRTGRETTQSTFDQLSYWASGLEPTYFDGAFARAR